MRERPDSVSILALLASLTAGTGTAGAARTEAVLRLEGPPTPARENPRASGAQPLEAAVRAAIAVRPPRRSDFVGPRPPRLQRGLFALGGYRPPQAFIGGIAAPPLRVYPGAGVGNSLNVNPWTGQRY